CPTETIKKSYWNACIAQALHRAKSAPSGPVHINCAFRKPFAQEGEKLALSTSNVKRHYALPLKLPRDDDVSMIADSLSPIENGVIIAGSLPHGTSVAALETLSRLLQWPIIADINSGLRSQGEIHGLARYYNHILGSLSRHDELRLDGVLHFGGPIVSQVLNEWITKHNPECYCHVADTPQRLDPHHIATHYFDVDPLVFAGELTQYLPGRGPSNWMALWKNLSSIVLDRIQTFFAGGSEISEPEVIRLLNDLPSHAAVFVGNSMPIRDADSFFFPKQEAPPLFANRGTSGIDGNIATAAGICQSLDRPTLAILGDQTTLHDLNSLAFSKKLNQPLIILTINNGGGGIFSFLPVAQKHAIVEDFFAAAHDLHFKSAAQIFGLHYHQPKTVESLKECVLEALEGNAPCLIEVITSRRRNVELHHELLAELSGINPKAKTAEFPCYAAELQ
ncbi:MAG TPA: thiamine pyrophosphate-dependent enzyme, partial [Chlamydiales bacterium]|nr:thiamine pyrophosphate-dependent enzyme [Chlamydiales bacterium]